MDNKVYKLCFDKEFKYIYRRGKSFVFPSVVVYCVPSKDNSISYAVVSSKKIGTAVKRNRARRVVRAAFKNISNKLTIPCKLILVCRTRATENKSTVVQTELEKAFTKAGLI